MAKYTIEQKIEIVKEYRTGSISQRGLSKKYNIPDSVIRRWIRKAELHGFDSLKRKQSKRFFDGNEKLSILDYMLTNGLSITETAIKFDIEPSMVIHWQTRFDVGGIDALKAKRGRPNKHMTNS
ncbi:hypothetical protein EQG49_09275 [Periweissella cryptocerci]|uniref:Insertion element IS150 protein InsJ-like helix-turn-helix domain-containing protein n=1 Tax=Periweissella cryptocerci TaxID=2506420 RepID=A0A4P6YVA4_9LACO|nr:helix-turn-helix domain-containing protein [Periweissella cryptocerci]QBO36647.1 hypothetical protein EQG49_09275 [Periweissella cryptocerci]